MRDIIILYLLPQWQTISYGIDGIAINNLNDTLYFAIRTDIRVKWTSPFDPKSWWSI